MLSEILERRRQNRQIGWVIGIILLLLVSMFQSCNEARYAIWGKTVEAPITTRVEKQRDGSSRLVVGYSFVDDKMDKESFRQEYRTVPLSWPRAGEKSIKVQYIPGKERMSRFDGEHNTVWMLLFFGSLAAAGIGAFVIARQK